jgi:hypothetical protein
MEGFFLLFLDILGGHTCGDILDLLCGDGPLAILGF